MQLIQHLAAITRKTVIAGVVLYTIGIVYCAIVWTFAADRAWWIAVSNIFAPLFFLPLPLIMVLTVFVRNRYMLISGTTSLVIFCLLFGTLFIPRLPFAVSDDAALRVASLNQFWGNQQVEAVISALRGSNADVIALQELSPTVAQATQKDLASIYPYAWLEPAEHSGGIGILSKYPLNNRQLLLGGRVQQVSITVDTVVVTIVNVHLHFNSIRRNAVVFWGDIPILTGYDSQRVVDQIDHLLENLAHVEGNLIVLGDFNMGEREPGYAVLRSAMRDAFREAGWGFGFSFPNHKSFYGVTIPIPLVRLDYVWIRGAITTSSAEFDCRHIGADHCMLHAALHLE